jgi:hypothetical protein
MYVHCTVAAVYVVAKSKNIRLFIDIPLVAGDRYFVLCHVQSLTLSHNGVGKYNTINEILLT